LNNFTVKLLFPESKMGWSSTKGILLHYLFLVF